MKNSLPIIFLSVFFFCLLAVIIWTLPDLLPRTERYKKIDPADLLVTLDDFPPGWQVEGVPEYEPIDSNLHWGDVNKVVRFHPVGYEGYAYHFIFKFRNELDAKYGLFRIKQQGFFTPLAMDSLEGFSYESPRADDWVIGCWEEKACHVLARYDEFISAFATSVNPEYMTREDLEIILKAIDEKMSKYLDIN